MTDIELRNENGKIVAYDQNGNKVPVSYEALDTDELYTASRGFTHIVQRDSSGDFIAVGEDGQVASGSDFATVFNSLMSSITEEATIRITPGAGSSVFGVSKNITTKKAWPVYIDSSGVEFKPTANGITMFRLKQETGRNNIDPHEERSQGWWHGLSIYNPDGHTGVIGVQYRDHTAFALRNFAILDVDKGVQFDLANSPIGLSHIYLERGMFVDCNVAVEFPDLGSAKRFTRSKFNNVGYNIDTGQTGLYIGDNVDLRHQVEFANQYQKITGDNATGTEIRGKLHEGSMLDLSVNSEESGLSGTTGVELGNGSPDLTSLSGAWWFNSGTLNTQVNDPNGVLDTATHIWNGGDNQLFFGRRSFKLGSFVAFNKTATNTLKLIDAEDRGKLQVEDSAGNKYFESTNGKMQIPSGAAYRIGNTDVLKGAPRGTWSTSNTTADRTFDADSTTQAEIADVLGTLIEDLQFIGLLG